MGVILLSYQTISRPEQNYETSRWGTRTRHPEYGIVKMESTMNLRLTSGPRPIAGNRCVYLFSPTGRFQRGECGVRTRKPVLSDTTDFESASLASLHNSPMWTVMVNAHGNTRLPFPARPENRANTGNKAHRGMYYTLYNYQRTIRSPQGTCSILFRCSVGNSPALWLVPRCLNKLYWIS